MCHLIYYTSNKILTKLIFTIKNIFTSCCINICWNEVNEEDKSSPCSRGWQGCGHACFLVACESTPQWRNTMEMTQSSVIKNIHYHLAWKSGKHIQIINSVGANLIRRKHNIYDPFSWVKKTTTLPSWFSDANSTERLSLISTPGSTDHFIKR